jgi:hypothetical protein
VGGSRGMVDHSAKTRSCEERLSKFHDTYATSFARSNFLVTTVDGVVELVEALGFVAILAPLARSCQEAVLAFERPNDDPHSVSDPWSFFIAFWNNS